MRKNLKKLFSYYKPYMGIFIADMFFAFGAAAVSLVIPLVVRYITSEVVHWESSQALHTILRLGVIMLVLIAVQCYCNYFISNYGHVMGAKIEYDMRAEIFSHYQKLSFRFYDDQKVGQLMSRITSDLFDITELLHHGPENRDFADSHYRCFHYYGKYQSTADSGSICTGAVYAGVRLCVQQKNEARLPYEPCENCRY